MDVKAARAAHLQRQLGIVQAEQARSSDALGRYLGRADLFTLVLSCAVERLPSSLTLPHTLFLSLYPTSLPLPAPC